MTHSARLCRVIPSLVLSMKQILLMTEIVANGVVRLPRFYLRRVIVPCFSSLKISEAQKEKAYEPFCPVSAHDGMERDERSPQVKTL